MYSCSESGIYYYLFDVYLYIYVHYIAYPFKDALSSKHFMEKLMSLFWLVMPSHDSLFLKL
jgi:hypothetical protein